jgi:hypothetical protein
MVESKVVLKAQLMVALLEVMKVELLEAMMAVP